MSQEKYDALLLENQLCFPLYACSREVIKRYRPYLEELNLTYTQYVVLMVIWEEKTISVRDLGKRLFLDSGTLTPVLKTLEKAGLITRQRSKLDERVLMVILFYRICKSPDIGFCAVVFVQSDIPMFVVNKYGAVFGLCRFIIPFQKSEYSNLPPFLSAVHAPLKLNLYNNIFLDILQVLFSQACDA